MLTKVVSLLVVVWYGASVQFVALKNRRNLVRLEDAVIIIVEKRYKPSGIIVEMSVSIRPVKHVHANTGLIPI